MSKKARLLSLPYLVWMIGFIVIPLALVFVFGLTDRSGAFTLENVISIVERNHLKALKLSVLLSFVSTVICFLLAFPLALILRGKTLLEKNGVINGFLTALHLKPINIINTPTAIVLGMVYNFLPFMVLPLYNTMCKIEDSIVEAARDLGASSLQTLWRIWLPLSVPGIVSGVTMVFVPALTTFVISNILGGSKILLIGNVIETEFTKASNWNLGSGLSIVMLLFILLSMTVLARYDKNGEGTAF